MSKDTKTKEDLLKESQLSKLHESNKTMRKELGDSFDEGVKDKVYDWVLTAMDEYAEIKSRERAIAFKNWLDKRSRVLSDEAGQMPIMVFVKYETNDQLYDLFDKQQTEKQ